MGKRIVLVAGCKSISLIRALFLRTKGHTVDSFESAEEADLHLRNGKYDVVVLDSSILGKQGEAFGGELRRRHPTLRIVYLASEIDHEPIRISVPACVVLAGESSLETLLEYV